VKDNFNFLRQGVRVLAPGCISGGTSFMPGGAQSLGLGQEVQITSWTAFLGARNIVLWEEVHFWWPENQPSFSKVRYAFLATRNAPLSNQFLAPGHALQEMYFALPTQEVRFLSREMQFLPTGVVCWWTPRVAIYFPH